VNAFHFCGIAAAVWALVLTFIGVTRENFPSTDGAARAVMAISVVLALAAIGSGIYTAATEEEEGGEEEESALLLPR
jgi:predicted transporter